jgi:hypothetical protein
VAIARALTIHTAALDLPSSPIEDATPFRPDEAPQLTTPHRSLARLIGWENFHSLGVATAAASTPVTSTSATTGNVSRIH